MIRAFFVCTLIFYIAAVAIGVSVVHREFNRMVAPAEPVSAFNLDSAGPGALRFEFLGETLEVRIPEALNLDMLIVESQRAISTIGKEVARAIKSSVDEELSEILKVYGNAAACIFSNLYSKILELLENLPEKYLPADWKTYCLAERHNN